MLSSNITKYYRYHYNNGHIIDKCSTLDKVEELVEHLKRFVRCDDKGTSHFRYRRFDDRRDGKKHREKEEM